MRKRDFERKWAATHKEGCCGKGLLRDKERREESGRKKKRRNRETSQTKSILSVRKGDVKSRCFPSGGRVEAIKESLNGTKLSDASLATRRERTVTTVTLSCGAVRLRGS